MFIFKITMAIGDINMEEELEMMGRYINWQAREQESLTGVGLNNAVKSLISMYDWHQEVKQGKRRYMERADIDFFDLALTALRTSFSSIPRLKKHPEVIPALENARDELSAYVDRKKKPTYPLHVQAI
jgi:hypothetical protein